MRRLGRIIMPCYLVFLLVCMVIVVLLPDNLVSVMRVVLFGIIGLWVFLVVVGLVRS